MQSNASYDDACSAMNQTGRRAPDCSRPFGRLSRSDLCTIGSIVVMDGVRRLRPNATAVAGW